MTVNTPDPEIVYYTTEDLANMFRTEVSTIRYWRQCGTGPPGVRFGRRVLYRQDDVDTWVAGRRGVT
jgi:DNA-binding transcriptional MerR regulator